MRREDRQLVLGSFFQNYFHFQQKLYKGCEFRTGTPVGPVEAGKKGIARGYVPLEETGTPPNP